MTRPHGVSESDPRSDSESDPKATRHGRPSRIPRPSQHSLCGAGRPLAAQRRPATQRAL